mmetsp:Transcript_40756/g.63628  ORF Transcript_40756/g.63628 Transcript_40756/m.63628 type:complete len:120 (-) Transcript_40756:13-372(-)
METDGAVLESLMQVCHAASERALTTFAEAKEFMERICSEGGQPSHHAFRLLMLVCAHGAEKGETGSKEADGILKTMKEFHLEPLATMMDAYMRVVQAEEERDKVTEAEKERPLEIKRAQ